MKKLTKKKGFTLVELLVVVAIIAILMLLALPKFMDQTKGAKVKTFESNTRTLISAMSTVVASSGGAVPETKNVDIDNLVTQASDLNGKPAKATYAVVYKAGEEAKAGVNGQPGTPAKPGELFLIATLDKGQFAPKDDGNAKDYIIAYNASSGKIAQTEKIPGQSVIGDVVASGSEKKTVGAE